MKTMKLSAFNYHLPKSRIAQQPLLKRDNAKLMVLSSQGIAHQHFYSVPDYLQKDDVLVINTTKVRKAKLVGTKSTGAKIELVHIKKIGDLSECRIKGHRIKEGTMLCFGELRGEIVRNVHDVFFVRFNRNIDSYLEDNGNLPLPFYITKKLDNEQEYQTSYASEEGSLAAPTAGLHFTHSLLDSIRKKGVIIVSLCLHIGFGTFLPIRGDQIEEHIMHEEYFEISKKSAQLINQRKGRLFVVGTTVVRALEAAFSGGIVHQGNSKTRIYIYPGYTFKNKINGMITNFHLPKSSLLLLVSAYYGRNKILNAYKEAIRKKYRFYSFGDAMLLLK